ncbi:hypothetical protein [Paracoccus yeei]|uniref:Uncharacterized protein n=1 Tax=Paracoccus yeei TaxID=147645 RepID=A0A5P2QN43_9RHOB|nr:hypothetical protein [Paracoccus yeei]QEU07411.1 hypothetical protein FOB51_04895 [Paracoccus yeei]
MLVSLSIAGWIAYDEPGFSNSVGMPVICFWRAVSLVLLCLIFLSFELVALWAELPEAFLGLLCFGSLRSFFFIPWEWSGRRAARRREHRFCFWIFDRRLCRFFYFGFLFVRGWFDRVTCDRVGRAPPR